MSQYQEIKSLETNDQTHPVVLMALGTKNSEEQEQRYKNVMKHMAFTEIFLGTVSMIIGIATLSLSGGSIFLGKTFTVGEGLWGGFWIVVAGSLGLHAAKPKASRSMIYSHLGFSIFGSIFSAALFVMGIISTVLTFHSYIQIHLVILFVLLSTVSISSLIFLVISACYCCTLTGCCKSQGSNFPKEQMVYVHQPDGTFQQYQKD